MGSAGITLRPLTPRDREAFGDFVRTLSPGSRAHRFLSGLRELGPAALKALTEPQPPRHVAYVATEGERIVGEGRVVALGDSGRGEFAIAVSDDWQRHGIGAHLLGTLIAAARRAGLAVLEGEVLGTNAAMLRFMRRAGFRLKSCPGDARLVLVERDLRMPALST
jgi:acetyltransferase